MQVCFQLVTVKLLQSNLITFSLIESAICSWTINHMTSTITVVLHSQTQPSAVRPEGSGGLSVHQFVKRFHWAISGLQTANDIHKPPMILHTHTWSMNIISSYTYINWGGWIYLATYLCFHLEHLTSWCTDSHQILPVTQQRVGSGYTRLLWRCIINSRGTHLDPRHIWEVRILNSKK